MPTVEHTRVERSHTEGDWEVWLGENYLVAFKTRRAARTASGLLNKRLGWCRQPDKLAKLPEVIDVNVGISDF